MKNKIILKDLVMQYGSGNTHVVALDNINLEFTKGESVVLIGASGSGKSTLLQIIGGLTTPTAGFVSIFGNDLEGLNDNQLSEYRNSSVGFVFQSFNLQSYLTAAENVAIPLLIRGVEKRVALKEANEVLSKIGMAERADHKPRQLSGGEMQRVAIARALASKPSIILADEPTGNLDKKSAESVMKLFKEVESWGVTVVVVTHDHRIADEFSRKIEVGHGEVVSDSKSVKSKKVKTVKSKKK